MSRVVIVSDDMEVRQTLIAMLSSEYWMMLPECVDSSSAMGEVNRVRPRLVVVQAELRNRNGLELAQDLMRVCDPAIVLVARTGGMAARGFDVGITDYIVMPVRPERLARAVQRALGRRPGLEPVPTPASARGKAEGTKLRVKSKGGFIFLKSEELVWVEAAGNYLNLHCVDRVYRVREPLTEFNARLDGSNFVRIHRSIIVNTTYIRELRSWGMGDYVVVLRNGKELPVSRTYRDCIDSWMGNSEFRSAREGLSSDSESSRFGEGNEPMKALPA